MDLYERLTRADELRKEAKRLSTAFYMSERRDFNSAEWKRICELGSEADELDGTAYRKQKEEEARKAAHEERMAQFHQYPPEVRAKQKQARITQTLDRMAALIGQPDIMPRRA
jgi:hypothetical protein